jgi:hypothetical protein
VQKQPELGANIILHLTFSEAIKEHKSVGTWQGEGLIAIEDPRCLEGGCKTLRPDTTYHEHVLVEGETQVDALQAAVVCRQREICVQTVRHTYPGS